jgi:UDPglucose 6-dehydrogenase
MRITIIGGGHVGLVSAACFADLGHSVDIIEADKKIVEMINCGIPPFYESGLNELLIKNIGKNLRATTSYEDIHNTDATFICVGTPPLSDGSVDLSSLRSAGKLIGEALQNANRYHAVVMKSTAPPSTTRLLLIPSVLRNSGKKFEEIGFAVNPEFLREGTAVQDFLHPDRIVVGSQDSIAGDLVESIYRELEAPILRTSLDISEMIKYTSNAFLATKISFSNEIGNICKGMDIDVYEVMRGIGMDTRIAPSSLNAGVGFGGSCFPKDVLSIIRLAEELGEDPCLLKAVIKINESQPLRIVNLLEKRIGDLRGKRIAILGLAFKKDTDDVRESRTIPVILELRKSGAIIFAYDPKANSAMHRIIPDINYSDSAAEALDNADACAIMTDWDEFRQLKDEFNLMKSRVIIEGRRILSCPESEGICW